MATFPGLIWCQSLGRPKESDLHMFALIVLLLILAVFGGFGFAVHALWFVLIAALLLWAVGWFVGAGAASGGRRGWYGR
jgi:energy-coupling factor transporter transmembrane protein EcfT